MDVDHGTLPHGQPGLPIKALTVEVTEGPDAGKTAVAEAGTLTIGSHTGNDLVLTDPTVSRHHVDLIRQGDRILVIDHGSTNGTSLFGALIERAQIQPGTVLRLGKTSVRITDGATVTLELFDGDHLGPLYGSSPAMRQLMAKIRRAGASDTSVLVIGETGTGKELAARTLHEVSRRKSGPFETVDCGAVLPTLIASELFGHEQGAFTGADRQHIGAFERADGGTLFLDEIGELPPAVQTALLGALERRSFRRVGGQEKINVDVRLVSATNRDLRGEVNRGTFRADLYYRIAVVTLSMPALRDRREDLPILAERFLRASGFAGRSGEILSPEVLESFAQYGWPGNVRELRNAVESLVVMGEAPELTAPSTGAAKVDGGREGRFDDLLGVPYNDARARLVEDFEGVYLRDLLRRTDGNVSQAAREGHINRSHLTRLVKKHGLRLRRVGTGDED